ncbi:Methionine aminopeptidase [Mucinivorans hirudinis]|uniref:Methionine aminopeptidase n=1 Tax=Mucinivorans hirudinis TaxID=1433126 RepID=A0A060R785_9BACT|nr:Methionine aminopeptidase [Mucinivorans hirudinis]
MINLKTKEEIELMRLSNELVSKTLGEIARWVREGITTARLDQIAEEFIRDHGAQPGFKGYGDYPYTLCTSVNDVVVHGMPSSYVLKNGDIVSVDCGTLMNGFYGDSAYTFPLGEVGQETMELLRITKEALYKGIEAAGVGKRTGDISNAVQEHCQRHGFSVVREMVGHAIGRALHEEPQLPNYGKRGSGAKLQEGMVLCLEPMINAGRRNVIFERDGWTVRTADRRPSAHFELCFAMSDVGVDCLSTFKYIENC